MTVHRANSQLLQVAARLAGQQSLSTPARLGLTLLLSGALFCSSALRAEPADWQIDPEHFSIAFEVEHIGYQQQLGMFLEGSGQFRYDADSGELDAGRIEIRTDSVFTNLDARDGHLKGRDFLNVRRHPVIVFEASQLALDSTLTTGTLQGRLTILDETHPVELSVTINKRDRYPFGHRKETLGISANTTIKRSLWGMDYGVGNALVGDDVRLRFEFEAIRQ